MNATIAYRSRLNETRRPCREGEDRPIRALYVSLSLAVSNLVFEGQSCSSPQDRMTEVNHEVSLEIELFAGQLRILLDRDDNHGIVSACDCLRPLGKAIP